MPFTNPHSAHTTDPSSSSLLTSRTGRPRGRIAARARLTTAFALAALVVLGGLASASQAVGTMHAATETPELRAGRLVTQAFGDLLGRTPSTATLSTWSTRLVDGAPRVTLSNALTVSPEYRTILIQADYRLYLGRAADPGGLDGWLAKMAAGYTDQHVELSFIGSPEYYAAAGGTSRGWVSSLYADVLGRAASTSEVDAWAARMADGLTRTHVANGFLYSTEHLNDVVGGHYRHLLGRAADAYGLAHWVGAIQAGMRTETVIGAIVASAEYYLQPAIVSSSIVYRTAALYPWAVTAMANTSVGSGAVYESSTSTMTRTLLTGTPTINRDRWSIKIARAKTSDPYVYLTDTGKSPDVVRRIDIPTGLEPTAGTDRHVGIIQPDGVALYECYKFNKVDSTHYTSTYVNINDLRLDGLKAGSRASGISFLIGLIRSHEVADKKIPHTIAIGAPATVLKSGPVWPARMQDTQVGTNIYSGTIPMGTMFAIPTSVDLTKLGLSAEGLALGHALQDYGGHVLVQSGTVSLYTEPDSDLAATNRMKVDYQQKLYPRLRRLVNNTATNVSGGGTRRLAPAAPLG